MNTVNVRYQKTEAKIIEAFFELMKKKGFEDLSVKDILDRAAISKSTFYVHYQDKYELLDAFENGLLERFLKGEESITAKWFQEHPEFEMHEVPHLDAVIHVLYEDGEKYALLLSDKGDRIVFSEKFQKTIHKVWKRVQFTSKKPIPINYALAGIEGLAVSLIQEWVKNGCQESEEEFKTIFLTFFRHLTPNIIATDIKWN